MLQNARLTKPQLGGQTAVLCALNHGNLVSQGNDPWELGCPGPLPHAFTTMSTKSHSPVSRTYAIKQKKRCQKWWYIPLIPALQR